MVCVKNARACRRPAFAALLAGAGLAFGASLPAAAADLDYEVPRYGSVKDYYGDREPEWRPRRSARHDCVPREVVHEELRADGWRDFREPQARGDVVVVEARRKRSGRPFELTIDRCSGDVVAARPLAPPRRAYLRPFHDDDWRAHRRWRERTHWHERDDWREDRWAHGPRRYLDSY